MSIQDRPIGIFDSGIGGLTVFKAITNVLPHESLIYLGDTARVPYGTKSQETIVRYSLENASFLIEKGVRAIVVACNTSSACALSAIREMTDVPVLGVIDPGVKAALGATRNNNIGVIATSSTIMSNQYAIELKQNREDVRVISLACPLFVPLVEEGWVDNDVTRLVANKYLSTLKAEKIDTLILGCTHYPLLKGVIQSVMGDAVTIVDSATSLANELKVKISEAGDVYGLQDKGGYPTHHIYVTDLPAQFELNARRFISGDLPPVKRIDL